MRIPGLIDPHVHMREPGGEHKEDWDSGTAAALAGGVTTVVGHAQHETFCHRPGESLQSALAAASSKARCDFAQYLGAGSDKPKLQPLHWLQMWPV